MARERANRYDPWLPRPPIPLRRNDSPGLKHISGTMPLKEFTIPFSRETDEEFKERADQPGNMGYKGIYDTIPECAPYMSRTSNHV